MLAICITGRAPGSLPWLQLKVGGFVVFALAFFVSRVLLVPWAVLKVAFIDGRCAPAALLPPGEAQHPLLAATVEDARCRVDAGAAPLGQLHFELPTTCSCIAGMEACLKSCRLWRLARQAAQPKLPVIHGCAVPSCRQCAPVPCRRQLLFAVEDFFGIYLVLCALLTALYVMQLVWMRGILRVLR